jgi:hypothetical protein
VANIRKAVAANAVLFMTGDDAPARPGSRERAMNSV